MQTVCSVLFFCANNVNVHLEISYFLLHFHKSNLECFLLFSLEITLTFAKSFMRFCYS